MAMYDIWAVYDEEARPFLLGNTIGDFEVAFERFDFEGNVNEARDEAISHASYRLLLHRFQFSPECFRIQRQINEFFSDLGHDPRNASTDYQSGDPVALGNYVAQQIMLFGLIDGGNEAANYDNQFYEPVNDGFFLENREWEIFPIQIDGNLWFSTSLLIKVEILFLLHFTRTRNLEV